MLKHRSVQVSEPDQVKARRVGSGQDLHSIAARQFACCPLGKCRCQAGAASVSDAADSNQSQSRARSAQQLWRKAKQATQGISNHRRAIDAGKTERADSSHGQAGSFVEPESLHVQDYTQQLWQLGGQTSGRSHQGFASSLNRVPPHPEETFR